MKKQQFLEFWKNIENKDTQYRAFYLICSDKNKKFISIADFKVFFK